jgi:hypothetical protein
LSNTLGINFKLAEEVPGLKHLLVLILRVVSVLSGTIRPIDTGFVVLPTQSVGVVLALAQFSVDYLLVGVGSRRKQKIAPVPNKYVVSTPSKKLPMR